MKAVDKFYTIYWADIYICAKFHDSIPLLGKYCLFQIATRDVIWKSEKHAGGDDELWIQLASATRPINRLSLPQ